MPLMISPVDGKPMRQSVRFGIELDVCPTTGGVWLDREEFDKLARMIRDESGSPGHEHAHARRRWLDPHEVGYDDEDDDRRHRRRRRSSLSELFDL